MRSAQTATNLIQILMSVLRITTAVPRIEISAAAKSNVSLLALSLGIALAALSASSLLIKTSISCFAGSPWWVV
jgi:hypothetical protein